MKNRLFGRIVSTTLACAIIASIALSGGITAFASVASDIENDKELERRLSHVDWNHYTQVRNDSYSSAELYLYTTGTGENLGGTVSVADTSGGSFAMSAGNYRQYTATPNEGWVFKGWDHYNYKLAASASSSHYEEYRYAYVLLKARECYSYSALRNWGTLYNGTDATIQANRLDTWGEVAGWPIVYVMWANFNPTITAFSAENGMITYGGEGQKEVTYGADSEVYTITAEQGYLIDTVLIDGVPVAGLPVDATTYTYQFNAVTAPHNITFTTALAPVTYTVTYKDGAEGAVFADQIKTVEAGAATPKFEGNTNRADYIFTDWDITPTDTVEKSVVYTATWADDKNNNAIADENEVTISWYNDQGANINHTTLEIVEQGTVIDFTELSRVPIDRNYNDGEQAFLYWVDQAGNQYGGTAENQTYTVTTGITLTAVWKFEETPVPTPVATPTPTPTPEQTPDGTPAPSETPKPSGTPAPSTTPKPTPIIPVKPSVSTPPIITVPTQPQVVAPVPVVAPVATPVVEVDVQVEEELPLEVEQEEVLEELQEIKEEKVPLDVGDDIEIEEEVPLEVTDSTVHWALLNLILTITTSAASAIMIIAHFLPHETEKAEAARKRKALMRFATLAPAVVAIVFFVLTEDMTGTIGFVDQWSFAMLLIALVQTFIIVKMRREDDEHDDIDSTYL